MPPVHVKRVLWRVTLLPLVAWPLFMVLANDAAKGSKFFLAFLPLYFFGLAGGLALAAALQVVALLAVGKPIGMRPAVIHYLAWEWILLEPKRRRMNEQGRWMGGGIVAFLRDISMRQYRLLLIGTPVLLLIVGIPLFLPFLTSEPEAFEYISGVLGFVLLVTCALSLIPLKMRGMPTLGLALLTSYRRPDLTRWELAVSDVSATVYSGARARDIDGQALELASNLSTEQWQRVYVEVIRFEVQWDRDEREQALNTIARATELANGLKEHLWVRDYALCQQAYALGILDREINLAAANLEGLKDWPELKHFPKRARAIVALRQGRIDEFERELGECRKELVKRSWNDNSVAIQRQLELVDEIASLARKVPDQEDPAPLRS